jgi:DNA-binding PadR family transcriptional regulator
MSRRSELLEFAVLGLLHESPMHGYELRKRLNAALGVFRALSYGTLYPCLRGLLDQGLISEASATQHAAATAGSRRARIVYELTADGKEQFQELLKEAGPTAWEDDTFDVHLAFFARTEA